MDKNAIMQRRRQFFVLYTLLALLTSPISVLRAEDEPEVRRAIPVSEEGIKRGACVVFGVSTGDSLNVRSSPSANSKVLFTLTNEQEVQVTGNAVFNGETKWIPVNVASHQGWVNSEYLQPKIIYQNQAATPQITPLQSLPATNQQDLIIDQRKNTTATSQDRGFYICVLILTALAIVVTILLLIKQPNASPISSDTLLIREVGHSRPEPFLRLNNTENEAPPTNYSGFWLRLIAHTVDIIILIPIVCIAYFVSCFICGFAIGSSIDIFDQLTQQEAFSAGFSMGFTVSFILTQCSVWVYFAAMESSSLQGTFGKVVIGIKVTDISGARISFGRASGRYFGKFISTIILDIGWLMAAFTTKKQALHDSMADCLVVNR